MVSSSYLIEKKTDKVHTYIWTLAPNFDAAVYGFGAKIQMWSTKFLLRSASKPTAWKDCYSIHNKDEL